MNFGFSIVDFRFRKLEYGKDLSIADFSSVIPRASFDCWQLDIFLFEPLNYLLLQKPPAFSYSASRDCATADKLIDRSLVEF